MSLVDLPPRFREKIAVDDRGCWIWQAFCGPKDGYGRVWFRGRMWLAHRAVRTLLVGEIPADLEPDHLCRVRACVNPDPEHSELVTHRVNTLRGEGPSAIAARRTTCLRGHPYDSTRAVRGKRVRRCLQCHREWMRAARTR